MQQPTKNTVKYNGLVCECDGDVSLYLNGDNGYECKCGDVGYVAPIKKMIKPTIKKQSGCETTITEIYTSKESGTITICKGKLLVGNQKTRIVKVNE